MKVDDARLVAILRIGHDTSRRGAGLSLREALARTQYAAVRASFRADDLIALIKSDPNLSEQWLAYSQDKRTNGGWYLTVRGEIGMVETPGERMRFNSIEEAVAQYVVRELDFWAGVSVAG